MQMPNGGGGMLPSKGGGLPGLPGSTEPMQGGGNQGGEEQPNVTPEEQQFYDATVDNGLKLLYSPNTLQNVRKQLQMAVQDGAPVEALAKITARIAMGLEDSAKKSGAEIPGDILFHAGVDLLGAIAELSERSRIHTFTPEEMEQALYGALDIYGTQRGEEGTLNVDEISGEFQQLLAAEQEGRLDEVIPGITQKAEQIRKEQGSKGRPAGEAGQNRAKRPAEEGQEMPQNEEDVA